MRLAILGGGGFRVPLVYRALAAGATAGAGPRVDEVVLHDVSGGRLAVMAAVLEALADRHARAPKVQVVTGLDDALRGSDVVFSAMRPGGLDGRVRDERAALDLGLVGQETTGAGGIAYGLRALPVALTVAERVAALAPDAWVINFSNPAGMVTEAMQRVLGDRVVGICDSPVGLVRRTAGALGVDAGRAEIDYVGLNHLGWLRALRVGGRDLLPELLADPQRLESFEEGRLFGAPWLRALGALPNEYLFYYYFAPEAVAAGGEGTRGEFLRTQQAAFYDAATGAAPQDALALWEAARRRREETYLAEARAAQEQRDEADLAGGGYEGVALELMAALSGAGAGRLILDVRNGDTLPQLPADAVVEVPCTVDERGPRPLPAAPFDSHQLGLVSAVKAAERATIEAVTTRSRAAALRAFAFHPLVGSVSLARRLLDAHLAADPTLAALLCHDGD